VLTVGVDLASQPDKTAACQVSWRHGSVEIDLPEIGVRDARLLELIRLADKLGIDVPLGWPEAFVTAIAAHHEGRAWTGGDQRALWLRETDRVVHQQTRGRPPLSVSTDRIAIPAMRAARLLSTLKLTGTPVDPAGRGRVVEVYPAAALRRWGLPASGYKGKDGLDNRRRLVEGLRERAAWLRPSPSVLDRCEADDNALDALIAALVARAAACGLCEPIPADAVVLAEKEGWIALPIADSLERLAAAEVR
jgi:predicted nuclease with RNAse H fold